MRPSGVAWLCAQEAALALYDEMVTEHGMRPTKFHFCPLITVCGRAGQPDKALEIFDEMERDYARHSRMTFTAAIQACADAGRWRTALDLYMRLESERQQPHFEEDGDGVGERVSLNAILDALAPFTSSRRAGVLPPRGHGQEALSPAATQAADSAELLEPSVVAAVTAPPSLAATAGLGADDAVDDAATAARQEALRDQEQRQVLAEMLWERALELKVYGQFEGKVCRKTGVTQRFDLHTMSSGAAEMAVRWWLRKLRPQVLRAHDASQRLPTLCIVTGKGKSRPGWQQQDLRQSIEDLLMALGVPTITALHHNLRFANTAKTARLHEGALFVDAEALAWMARLEDAEQQVGAANEQPTQADGGFV